jgi:hypothetical protein
MGGKAKNQKASAERYLKFLYSILNLRDIDLRQTVLLSHIYSFGLKGCYQSNKTLAEIFMVSPDTISRWIADIPKYIYIVKPKGYYRTIYAKAHPDARAVANSQNSGVDRTIHLGKSARDVGQKCGDEFGKSAIRLNQKCPATNNNTNKETIKKTTDPQPPLPAGGQAAAVLTERKRQGLAEIEKFKKSFGCQKFVPMPEAEFEKQRQKKLKDLFARPIRAGPPGAG